MQNLFLRTVRYRIMDQTPEEIAEKLLKAIEKRYGEVPLVNRVMSRRPDIFIPSVNLGTAVLENKNAVLDRKMRFLAAISAATALGSPYCINVQMKHAIAAGANEDEILEAMMIGSYMATTRSLSYALRELDDRFPKDDKDENIDVTD